MTWITVTDQLLQVVCLEPGTGRKVNWGSVWQGLRYLVKAFWNQLREKRRKTRT